MFKVKERFYQCRIPFKIIAKNVLRFFIVTLIISHTVSCAGTPTQRPETLGENVTGISTNNTNNHKSEAKSETREVISLNISKSEKINSLLLEKAMNASLNVDYILGPDDLIEVDVFQVDELKRTVRVSSSGFIKLPLAGKIQVSGLTVPELEAEIGKRLQRYLQEPVVSAFIQEYRSQRITVLGAVKKPQVFAVTGQKFLLDMLSIAEGLEKEAGEVCYVQRESETIVINLNDLLIKGNARLNVPVFAGDVIHVPKGGIVFVSGAVNTPGSFVMQGSVTLTQAIAMAKGLKFEAKKTQIRIYRDTGNEIRDTIDVDYDNILEKKSSDIILRDKDIVIVPQSGAKSFFRGFVETLSGFISFGKAL